MELLNAAHFNNEFGLRRKFPWDNKKYDGKVIKDRVRYKERRYLTKLVSDVFDEDDYLYFERIENPYLWGRYVLQYEEMKANHKSSHVEEEIMIHATSSENAYSIAKDNFNWRLVSRARFGVGVSFANTAEYAERRATENDVYIVAGILVANSSPGYRKQPIPELGDDTTTGYTEDVCIKYYDNDFYPYYIIQEA